MSIAALLTLALLAGEPDAIKLAQAQGPLQTGQSADDERRAQALAEGDPLPTGAPTDDYGLLAWCHGALNGHMQLKPVVWPEVERIERQFPNPATPVDTALAVYEQQSSEGAAAIGKIEAALSSLEAKGRTGGIDRAAADAQGAQIWNGAASADRRQVAQLWMSWALPGRCTSTADRILAQ
ncbi:MAG TPA: hypothetical protein VF559_10560 [Caulobacteraceae bacterium]|jgi:hypothetical protein